MATSLRISEIYASVQGEGILTGTPSVFVRTSGCNLRCWFCDTRFASWEPEGDQQWIEKIVSQVAHFDCSHTVITGGEPMIFPEVVELVQRLAGIGHHTTIETAGTVYQPVECDLVSLSPKLSNSTPDASAGQWRKRHDQRRDRPDVVRRLMSERDYQLKFVVDAKSDCDEILAYLEQFHGIDRQRVMMMPQGTLQEELERRTEWLLPWCQQRGFQFCERAHIRWFGNQRGT